MVDRNTTVATTFGSDRLHDEGDDDDDDDRENRSQRSRASDLWETSGVRMSALCLNMLHDISDAASQCSAVENTENKSKKKKGFANFFKIKRKDNSKKSTADQKPVAADKLGGNKSHLGEPALIRERADGINERKGSDGNRRVESISKDGYFDVSQNKSATVPRRTGLHSNLKAKWRSSTAAEAAPSEKQLAKEKRNSLPMAEIFQGKTNRKSGTLKRLESGFQKFITNVNQKFPTNDDVVAKERGKGENTGNGKVATKKDRDEGEWRSKEPEVSNFDDISLEGYGDDGPMDNWVEINEDSISQTVEPEVDNPTGLARWGDFKQTSLVRHLPTYSRGRTREKSEQEKWKRAHSVETNGSGRPKRRKIRRRALSREWTVLKTTTTVDMTTIPPISRKVSYPKDKIPFSPAFRKSSDPEDMTTISQASKKVDHPEDKINHSPVSRKVSHADDTNGFSSASNKVGHPNDTTTIFPFSMNLDDSEDVFPDSNEASLPDDGTTTISSVSDTSRLGPSASETGKIPLGKRNSCLAETSPEHAGNIHESAQLPNASVSTDRSHTVQKRREEFSNNEVSGNDSDDVVENWSKENFTVDVMEKQKESASNPVFANVHPSRQHNIENVEQGTNEMEFSRTSTSPVLIRGKKKKVPTATLR